MKSQESYQKCLEALVERYGEREVDNIIVLLEEHWLALKEEDGNLDKTTTFTSLYRRLCEGEPINYIINKSWFYGLELFVDNRVLIPRSETEELVYWVEKDLKKEDKPGLRVLDIGTGSGCISLALKSVLPKVKMFACDLSSDALAVAEINRKWLNLDVEYFKADYSKLSDFSGLRQFDVVISNPPYITRSEEEKMSFGTAKFEPDLALFTESEDAIEPYKRILELSKSILKDKGYIYLEINEFRMDMMSDFLLSQNVKHEFRKDMQGRHRMLKIIT